MVWMIQESTQWTITFPVSQRFSHLIQSWWNAKPFSGNAKPQNWASEHTSPHVMSERQTPDTTLDPRCQSGPWARNSFHLMSEDSHRMGRWNSKTEVCICSQFPTKAVPWIKEVEMVDSVDDLRSSSSMRGISMPNFGVLDARIAPALNKIIHNSHFKRKVSL